MADDTTAEPVSGEATEDAPQQPKADNIPPEVKKALRDANNEAKTLRLELKEYKDRDKTEAERSAEAIAAVTSERDTAVAKLARVEAALKHGLDLNDLDLLGDGTPDEIEDRAKRLASRLAESGAVRKPQPDPTQGRRDSGNASTAEQFAAAIGAHL